MIPPRKYQVNKPSALTPRPASRYRQLWNRLTFKIHSFVTHQLQPWLAAQRSARILTHVAGPSRPLARAGVAVVSPYYGDARLVAPFLRHHRELGIKEFVFLDLSPDGDLAQRLDGDPAAIWRPRAAWKEAQVLHFLNALRNRYATGRWCLSLDVTDFFVFFRSESRCIADLIHFLQSERRRQIYALVVDMYGDGPVTALDTNAADDPLRALPYFDPLGYATPGKPSKLRETIVRGGVQRRAVHASTPMKSPALNRVPLIKWERFYAYISDTRLASPHRLNVPHVSWHTTPTACLLRFALLSEANVLARAASVEQAALVKDEGESGYLGLQQMRDMSLRRDFSRAFTSTGDLVDAGLLNPGQWF